MGDRRNVYKESAEPALPTDGVVSVDEFLGPEVVDGNEDEPWQVDVFAHNWITVMAYKLCRFDRIATMSHVIPVGVSSTEALSVFEVLGVELDERPDLLAGIRIMSNAACEYITSNIKT